MRASEEKERKGFAGSVNWKGCVDGNDIWLLEQDWDVQVIELHPRRVRRVAEGGSGRRRRDAKENQRN